MHMFTQLLHWYYWLYGILKLRTLENLQWLQDVYENCVIGSKVVSSMMDAVIESHTWTQRKNKLKKNLCQQVKIIHPVSLHW